MWLANKSVTLFVAEINRSIGNHEHWSAPALYLMISSRELYSCKCISNDQWWSCLSPDCNLQCKLQGQIIIRDQGEPATRVIHYFFWIAVLCHRCVRHLQAWILDNRVLWCADMRFTLILNDRSWTHLLEGAVQTHSTANANIRYRPPKYTYPSVWRY